MKQTIKAAELFLILIIVLKLVDFSKPTPLDIAMMVLFVIYAALDPIHLRKGK